LIICRHGTLLLLLMLVVLVLVLEELLLVGAIARLLLVVWIKWLCVLEAWVSRKRLGVHGRRAVRCWGGLLQLRWLLRVRGERLEVRLGLTVGKRLWLVRGRIERRGVLLGNLLLG
jgi:hypothetical protein